MPTEAERVRAVSRAVDMLRMIMAAPVVPSEAVLERVTARLAKLDYAALPEPSRSQLMGERSALMQALAGDGNSQNLWTKIRLHVEMAHAELSLPKKVEARSR